MLKRIFHFPNSTVLFISVLFLCGCTAEDSEDIIEPPSHHCQQTPLALDCPEGGLSQWLATTAQSRPDLSTQAFAHIPLSKQNATRLQSLLFDDYQQQLRQKYESQWQQRQLQLNGFSMPFYFQRFGSAQAGQRSLFISMHGGGGTTADVNNGQYVNQQHLYDASMRQLEGIYLAPRAPTDASDMWYKDHIDEFFSLLIQLAVIFEGIDPNRVYLMGYSAGGDGVYQLAPRMADRWAAASMMAGHPNASAPYSLANTPFTIHVGAQDSGYDRNLRAAEWGDLLTNLQGQFPAYYEHFVKIHNGYGHWMELQDAVALPWMHQHTRDPSPFRVHWQQTTQERSQLYWLSMPVEHVREKQKITVSLDVLSNSVNITDNYAPELSIWLNDSLLDLNDPISVKYQGQEIYSGRVDRTLANIYSSLLNKGDEQLIYSARLTITNNSIGTPN